MKHVFTFDADRCCACSACMIGCMDQNDIDVESGDTCFRKTYDTEIDLAARHDILRLSLAGLHALHGCIPASPPVQWAASRKIRKQASQCMTTPTASAVKAALWLVLSARPVTGKETGKWSSVTAAIPV